jgi:predicted phage terminase large subunit-like protein
MTFGVTAQVPLQYPEKLGALIQQKKTFKVCWGGRGGGKSVTIAQFLLMLGCMKKLRILCIREVMKSLKESSYQTLVDYIDKLGLRGEYVVTDKAIRHKWNGSVFMFSGLKDHTADSIKSFQGVDLVWAEEAHSITAESWEKLIPTILRNPGAEIWISFNPDDEEDYVYKRFVKGHDEDALVIEVQYYDNPWLDEAMKKERAKMKAANDPQYAHVWLGECRSITGKLFKRDKVKGYRPNEKPNDLRMYAGSDFAVSQDEGDWTEHGAAGLDPGGNLVFTDWWSGQTDSEIWIKAMVAMAGRVKPLLWFREKGVILRGAQAGIAKQLRRTKTLIAFEDLASAGNKADRAMSFKAMWDAGMVYFPQDANGAWLPWAEAVINQLCSFTGKDGKTDDKVDVCSIIARGLELMMDAEDTQSKDTPEPIKVGSRRHVEGLYEDPDAAERRRRSQYA